ncbi:unnamed protein product, partial [Polarella glacialis]
MAAMASRPPRLQGAAAQPTFAARALPAFGFSSGPPRRLCQTGRGFVRPLLAAAVPWLASARRLQQQRCCGSAAASSKSHYVDVHCHLTHAAFVSHAGEDEAVERARKAGLHRVVVNGVEPKDNRAVLDLCGRHPDICRAALGIYPLNASAAEIDRADFTQRTGMEAPEALDVGKELSFIDQMAAAGRLIAVGEAGLDKMYGYTEKLLGAQEEVLRELCRIAVRHRLPIIVHSRAAEERTFRVLESEGVELADFHCYTGKKKLAVQIAEAGYYFSMPASITRNGQFQALYSVLPPDRVLTETDAPYMAPERGNWPNEPCNVPPAISAMAK